jgi:hypothetical protein
MTLVFLCMFTLATGRILATDLFLNSSPSSIAPGIFERYICSCYWCPVPRIEAARPLSRTFRSQEFCLAPNIALSRVLMHVRAAVFGSII